MAERAAKRLTEAVHNRKIIVLVAVSADGFTARLHRVP
jgi:hypothetical protein